MTNTTLNVPRELMERARAAVAATNTSNWSSDLLRDIHAILSAPSPAGVDGLKRYEVFPYLDDEVAEIDICESDDGTFVKYEDAKAIIDGLRGEVEVMTQHANNYSRMFEECAEERDQQAQRIGELEGLLLRVQVSLSLDDTEWGYSGAEKYKLLADIRAAMSAGKEGE